MTQTYYGARNNLQAPLGYFEVDYLHPQAYRLEHWWPVTRGTLAGPLGQECQGANTKILDVGPRRLDLALNPNLGTADLWDQHQILSIGKGSSNIDLSQVVVDADTEDVASGDYQVGDASQPDHSYLANDWSISLWLYVQSSNYHHICGFGGPNLETTNTNYTLLLIYQSSELKALWEYGSGTNEFPNSNQALTLNTLYHVAVTKNTATKEVKFYLDGDLKATKSYTNEHAGGTDAANKFVMFDGNCGGSDVRVWSRVLDDWEVRGVWSGATRWACVKQYPTHLPTAAPAQTADIPAFDYNLTTPAPDSRRALLSQVPAL